MAKTHAKGNQVPDIAPNKRHKVWHGYSKRFFLIIFVFGFALVGMYLLVKSKAAVPGQPLTIKDTNYTIPSSNVVFVSTTGSDSNPGSQSSPYRTVTKGVQSVPNNGTVVIRAGTYRESIGGIPRPMTIQPYPHEQVWIKGSEVVTGWVQDGSAWRKDNWTYEFCHNCFDGNAIDSAYPLAGWPDMTFIDGQPLKQVDARNKVAPGTFFVDYTANQLFIGDNPSGKTVEGAARSLAINAEGSGSGAIIRGLGFSQFAPYYNSDQGGMVRINVNGITLVDNTFAYSAMNGLSTYGADTVLRGNTFSFNGSNGWGGYRADRLLAEQNEISYNNTEHWSSGWNSAGVKMAEIRDVIIRDNSFNNNETNGFWCDISCYNLTVVRNVFSDNKDHGFFYELSDKAIIASNIFKANGAAGINVSNSTNTRIYNNTFVRNHHQIDVVDDSRVNSNTDSRNAGITWISATTSFYNNIFSNNDGSSNVFLFARDYNSNPIKTADQMISASGTNAYYRQSASTPTNLVEWWRSGTSPQIYTSLSQYQSATSRDQGSASYDGQATNPFFVNESTGDYTLKSGSPAVNAGQPLPSDIASAIGVTAGVAVNQGALSWAGQGVTPPPPPPPGDTTPPTVSFNFTGFSTQPVDNAVVTDKRTVSMTISSSDASGIASTTATINGTPTTITGGTITTPNANGNYTISVTVKDNANNTTTKTQTILIRHRDFSRNGVVDLLDLSQLLKAWNTASDVYDFNNTTTTKLVDLYDLSFLMQQWGSSQ